MGWFVPIRCKVISIWRAGGRASRSSRNPGSPANAAFAVAGVEQDLARDERSRQHRALSEEEKKSAREREGLTLSRARVMKQIEASTNERYTKVLREALQEIEQKIAALESP
jgi:hypothetical protein